MNRQTDGQGDSYTNPNYGGRGNNNSFIFLFNILSFLVSINYSHNVSTYFILETDIGSTYMLTRYNINIDTRILRRFITGMRYFTLS